MKRRLSQVFKGILVAGALIAVSGFGYLQLPKFGALPEDEALAELKKSPNYSNGSFQNLEPIPEMTTDPESDRTWLDFLVSDDNGRTPSAPLPTVKTDLRNIDEDKDVMVWLGHSSFFIQLDGKTFLIDPVLSKNASPIPFTVQAFEGTSLYTAEDIPDVDYLLISHDHWDHLDYPTVKALKDRVGMVVCGLGVGTHFRQWGFPASQIHEADWNTNLTIDDDFTLHTLPARHFSGRWLERNKSLWVSFALQSPTRSLFFSGDSGYGSHFKDIGTQLGGFDLVMLDSGQYDPQWRYVHMMPEDAIAATQDLKATAMMPAHVGKFSLAFHTWDDPFQQLSAARDDAQFELVTPRIGEPVDLARLGTDFEPWWRLNDANHQGFAENTR